MAANSRFEKFLTLFAGRTDVYAKVTKVDRGKARYMKVKEPLTEEVLLAHIRGEEAVGVYPIVNNKVKWALVDIDGEKDPDTGTFKTDGWDITWKKAVEQLKALEALGLHAYIERSRSGYGAHVWVFFDDWIPAADARKIMLRYLTVPKVTGEVVYPVQDFVDPEDPEDYGNLLGLPFFGEAVRAGNSVFLDADGAVVPVKAFLDNVMENLAPVVQEIANDIGSSQSGNKPAMQSFSAAVDNTRPDRVIPGGLKVISRYGCKFMNHAWENRKTLAEPEWYIAIQQTTALHRGRELAHAISRDYAKYSEGEVNHKFDQALRNPIAGCAYIQQNFPHLACASCPARAPYQVANRSIIQLVQESSAEMERLGDFESDVELVRKYDSGLVQSGIEWGTAALNRHSRIRNSELTVIGGFPSLGKTAFMVDNAVEMARKGVTVPIFSAETSRKPLRMRFLSSVSGVDLTALRGERPGMKLTKQEWAAIERGKDELNRLPIYTDYTSMSPSKVLEQLEDILLRDNIPLDSQYALFFDYLQFGFKEPGEEGDYERLTRLAGEFKFLGKIVDHGVVLFSQLKRDKEHNDEDEEVHPEISWYAGTGAIERTMDAGFIITGKRVGGLFAPRKITKVKDRDGPAPMEDHLVLKQTCGKWSSPLATTTETENLVRDFT